MDPGKAPLISSETGRVYTFKDVPKQRWVPATLSWLPDVAPAGRNKQKEELKRVSKVQTAPHQLHIA